MSSAWPKVVAGQALRYPASLHNTLVDVARAHRSPGTGRLAALGAADYFSRVLVRNTDETDCPARGVLRLTGCPLDPSANLGQFLERPVLDGAVAASGNASSVAAVAVQKIPGGGVGEAAVAGVIQARVAVTDADHAYATPSESTAFQLDSAADAGFPILFKESGTGIKWAILLLEAAAPPADPFIWAEILTSTEHATNRFSYTWREVEPNASTPGSWSVVTGGKTSGADGLAYNSADAPNAATGVLGSGVDLDNLPAGFDPVPLGAGAVVELRGPYGDPTAWWAFTAAGHVDGSCA